MAGKRKLTKAYRRLDIQKADEINPIPGILGFPINGVNTVEVYNRPGYVYVRLRDNQSEVVQAFNTNVSPVYGLPVLIARDKINKSRYTVLSRDLGRYENWGTSSPYLPRHGAQHSFDPTAVGGDIVWVYNRQFMPLNVYPSGSFGSMNVLISEGTYYLNNTWHFAGNTGTASFAGYKPTGSSARMVLVYLDSNDNPQLVAGSYFASTLTGTSQIFSFIPTLPVTTGLPLAGIRLVSGTSIISWDNIYDVRPFIVGDGFIPTGTTGHVIADEGTPLANRPTLDFKGVNVWAIDNAGSNKTDIIVSGSGAGSLPDGEIGFGNGTSIISDPYFIYDTSNRQLIVGKNTMDGAGHTIEIWGDEDDGYQSELFMYKYAGTGFIYPPLIRSNMARGTTAYPAPVLSGDKIFELASYGWSTGTSGDFWAGFKLQAYAIESWLGGAGGRSSTYLLMQLGSINAQGVYNVARFDTSEVNFAGSVNISGTVVPKAFQLRAGATNGYVLTSDADGVGTWAIPTGGGSGTTNNYYYSTPNTVSVFDDGVFKVSGTALSFDAGLVVSVTGTVAYISSTGTSSSSTGTIGHIIEDETTPLTQRSKLSFQGAGVTATDDAGNDRTIVTIPGATGTSGASANNVLPIYGNNTFVVTGTAAVFNSNLTVSASGTIAYINANAGVGAGLNVVGIFDDGTFKVSGTAISFDSGLYVSVTGTVAYVNSSGTSSVSTGTNGHIIEDEGTPLTARGYLNFAGNGVTVTDDSGNNRTLVTIPGYMHVFNEDHSSECNSTGTQFSTIDTFASGTSIVTLNGITQRPGAGNSYVETAGYGSITFATAPHINDELLISYIKEGGGGSSGGGGESTTTPANLYIATTGSDTTGDGTAGNPYATMAKALSVLPYHMYTSCTIHVADGTYTEAIDLRRFRCQDPVKLTISGNTSTPANVIFAGTLSHYIWDGNNPTDNTFGCVVAGGINAEFDGIELNVSGTTGLLVDHHAYVTLYNTIVTGTISKYGVRVTDHSTLELHGNNTISGVPFRALNIGEHSQCNFNVAGTLTITGNGTDTIGIYVGYGGKMVCGWVTGLNISITEVFGGIICVLGSVFQHYSPTGSITIDNTSTPTGSIACQSADSSTWSTTQAVTIDHFDYGFWAYCVAYLEAIGSRTLTNVNNTSSTSLGGVVYLP